MNMDGEGLQSSLVGTYNGQRRVNMHLKIGVLASHLGLEEP